MFSMKVDERCRWLIVVSGVSARVIVASGGRRVRCRNSVVSSVSFSAMSFSVVSFSAESFSVVLFPVVSFSVMSFSVAVFFSVVSFFVWEYRLRCDRCDMD